MIEIKGLEKRFDDTPVLKGIDITIPDGQIYGLVGVSGAGKSTLLRCINGLERFDEGQVLVDGVDVSGLSEKELRSFRSNIGMIFQNFSLLERKTVRENVAFPMKCHGVDKDKAAARVDELLALVGLAEKADARPGELSGGQKQRVAIARALTLNPKVLLCDEATSALDPNTSKSVLDLLKHINAEFGITIVVVTHAMSVVKEVCDAAAILDRGVLVYKGDVQDLFLHHTDKLESVLGRAEDPANIGPSETAFTVVQRDGEETLLSRIALEAGIEFKVVYGGLEHYRNGTAGSYVITVPSAKAERFQAFLDEQGDIDWSRVRSDKEA